jgi:hypothetical protein
MRFLTCLALFTVVSVAHASTGYISCEVSPNTLSTLNVSLPLNHEGGSSGSVNLYGTGAYRSLVGVYFYGDQLVSFVNAEAVTSAEVKKDGKLMVALSYSWIDDTGSAKVRVNGRLKTFTGIKCTSEEG